MMTANEVRESFKKFFEGKGHKIVPSAPMVIKDDPTLMFTNAGMNQWKDIILGTKDPGKDVRRVDTQKCLLMGGFNFKEPKRLQTLSALVNGLTEAVLYRTQTAQQPFSRQCAFGR